jgi:hypothetical protein
LTGGSVYAGMVAQFHRNNHNWSNFFNSDENELDCSRNFVFSSGLIFLSRVYFDNDRNFAFIACVRNDGIFLITFTKGDLGISHYAVRKGYF